MARLRDEDSPPGPDPVDTERAARPRSYSEILESSATIGAASVVVILVGVVRTKAMAVLLGPAGFGLMGVFSSLIDLTASVAGLGVGSSGVRQIASAVSTGDARRIAITIRVLNILSIVLGVAGSLALLLFREPIADFTFGDERQAWGVAGLGFAVLCRVVAAGQSALLQGMRRIRDVAMIGLIGAVLGSVAGVLVLWQMGDAGIVPALVGVSAGGLAASWWYSRRVHVIPVSLGGGVAGTQVAMLLRLGAAFMASGFLTMGAAYAVRALVLQAAGADAAGYYQAAWTIGGLYVGVILQAMGTDFYPRLTGVAADDGQTNRLVNEQTQVGLLLAAPGVIATLGLASFAITLLYSTRFAEATGALRWICLGMTLRVISWPMGYIILARARQSIFFLTELAWAVVNVWLSVWLVRRNGVDGAGMAFFGSYVFHLVMIYAVANRMTGFSWSRENRRVSLFFVSSVGAVFLSFSFLPFIPALVLGGAVLVLSSIYSLRKLVRLVDEAEVPMQFRAPLKRLQRVVRA